MKNKHKIISAIFVISLLIFFFMSIYITVEEEMPNNAVVIISLEDGLYHSIHFDFICLENKTAKTTTLADAIAEGYKPDPHCQSLGYFRGNTRFLLYQLLFKLGVEVDSRWDKYGNWLW